MAMAILVFNHMYGLSIALRKTVCKRSRGNFCNFVHVDKFSGDFWAKWRKKAPPEGGAFLSHERNFGLEATLLHHSLGDLLEAGDVGASHQVVT